MKCLIHLLPYVYIFVIRFLLYYRNNIWNITSTYISLYSITEYFITMSFVITCFFNSLFVCTYLRKYNGVNIRFAADELFILCMRISQCCMRFSIINYWIAAFLDLRFIFLYVAFRYLCLQSYRLVLTWSSDRLYCRCLYRTAADLFIFRVTFTSNTEESLTY